MADDNKMKINNKEITLAQIVSILTIIGLLSSSGFFVHGYFAKSHDIIQVTAQLDSYKTQQQAKILRLKQEAQLNIWSTEQTFIVIRKDTILDRLSTESKKEEPDSFQTKRWEDQLDSLTAREAEIKTARESLKLQMLSQ